ncbi:thiamine phosphate synthase [Qipengyuania nanhaisediminis]|uniref:thiamine phosphate synthase n=1 Tax=Qipengyuania nanhaisediminis TaxID=604088 RepID=UPI0038B37EDD
MASSTPLPALWLISDARNDAVLEAALRALPRGSGFVYRHYHLGEAQRYARYLALMRHARARSHIVVLADSALTAREWGADGIYGAPRALWPRRAGLLRIATVHGMDELAQANLFGCDAMMISPVFGTNSHPDAAALGPAAFHGLARHALAPVIALGGMDSDRARALGCERWAAIDGLTPGAAP